MRRIPSIRDLFDLAAGRPRPVVFPEWDAPQVAEARRELMSGGHVHPVPLCPVTDDLVAALLSVRPMREVLARRMLEKPLIRAAAMVTAGLARAMVAGAEAPTRRVVEAASLAIGLAPGAGVASSFFLMLLPDGRATIFADCAVNVAPDAVTLAAIARASARSAERLLGEARPAFLSYSTGTSGAGPSVDIVRAAAALTGFPGPVQADAALNAAIAARKGAVTGNANVLIFPSLDAGNIAYKLVQELAGARAIGPILQGFAHPVCDLSRGATVEDIVAAAELTAALI